MRIGSLARETGVSERMLRYYEECGLLRPVRLPSGYRQYSEADVITVRHIRSLLAANLPTTLIAQVLPCIRDDQERLVPTCPELVAILHRERARVTEAILRLHTSQRLLDDALAAVPSATRDPRLMADALNAPTSRAGPHATP